FNQTVKQKNKYVKVKETKSRFDGDMAYWSDRKLYDFATVQALKRQNHTCGYWGLKINRSK
ncbi:MAG: RNA-dependent DNA polymerase, partial [Oscillatoriaceae bacterium SKYG93]|nr:RNA-dependent DNA polymerase [Oscillatoriaceae bacterium SKYG93]MDW8451874.1 RNA-dependent DNA polymerase [Oscillatoriaceae cyanobacterium SKYGB_i_bin93]